MTDPSKAAGPASNAGAKGASAVKGAVKSGAQAVAEKGVKKATGSDIAVDAFRGAQKAKSGDLIGGAQDTAASLANAGVTAAVGSTGVGAPVATLAGSAAGKLTKSRAGRWAIIGIVIAVVASIAVQALMLFTVSAAVIGAISPIVGEGNRLKQQQATCATGGGYGGGVMSGNGVQEQIWNYLTTSGFSEEQAAGIMGNMHRESGLNPFRAESDTGTPRVGSGWGLVQWTAGRHAAIRDAVLTHPGLGERFYRAAPSASTIPEGLTEADVTAMTKFQLDYIINELEGPERRAATNLKGATTVEQATMIFERDYERAGVVALAERTAAAKAIYAKFAGKPAPASSSDDASASDTPDTPAAPAAPNSGVTASACGPGSSVPGTAAGQIQACPSGQAGCVNLAYLSQPSDGIACAPGTTDRGIDMGYYKRTKTPIRLCALDRTKSVNGTDVLVNSRVSKNFVAFDNELVSLGQAPVYTSSYRSMAEQTAIYNRNTGRAAEPGNSNHQFGMAFDISGLGYGYDRKNCGGKKPDGACITPTSSLRGKWETVYSVGRKHGMYIHDQEFWHIEFTPSGLHRGRAIPHYQGE